MRFSKKTRIDGPFVYNFQEDNLTPRQFYMNIYEDARLLDESEVFDLDVSKPESALEQIVGYVQFRTKITKREIFKIGELLCKAKKICSENNLGFMDWIDQEFDFSYETANNFMNVFKQCFGQQTIAVKMPASILYKISKPSFPEELREYIFETADLEELSGGKLANLKKRYEEGGFEAVQEDIEELSRVSLTDRQIKRRMDLVENYLRHLNEILKKYKGDYTGPTPVAFETQMTSLEPEAVEISTDLWVAIRKAYDMVKTAYDEAIEKQQKFINKAKERL